MLKINMISSLPEDLSELIHLSLAENFCSLQRLKHEYDQQINRFDAPGDALFEARLTGRLVAICGLNKDPFSPDTNGSVGRVRRFYVHPGYRQQGIGQVLLKYVETYASGFFQELHLYTDTQDAAQFYLKMGYDPYVNEHSNFRKIKLKANL